MTTQSKFNEHLADAFCTALLLGQESEAEIFLSLPSFPHHLLIEKFCEALDTNNTKLIHALAATNLIDINGFNENGDTPLIHALRYQRTTMATIASLMGLPNLDVNQKSKYGQPAIHFAARPDRLQSLHLLRTHPDIDINATDKDGFTALMISARYENIHVVSEILKHPDLDINAQNKYGATALMLMVSFENERIVRLMLNHPNIDTAIKDRDGRTASNYALIWGNTDIQKQIKSYDIN